MNSQGRESKHGRSLALRAKPSHRRYILKPPHGSPRRYELLQCYPMACLGDVELLPCYTLARLGDVELLPCYTLARLGESSSFRATLWLGSENQAPSVLPFGSSRRFELLPCCPLACLGESSSYNGIGYADAPWCLPIYKKRGPMGRVFMRLKLFRIS